MDFILYESKGRTTLNQINVEDMFTLKVHFEHSSGVLIRNAEIKIDNFLNLIGEEFSVSHIRGNTSYVGEINLEVSETELVDYLKNYYISDDKIIRKTESLFGFFKKEKIFIKEGYYFKKNSKKINFTVSNFKINYL